MGKNNTYCKNLVTEFKNGLMVHVMKVNGNRTELTVRGNFTIQMEITMKENGLMIKQMVMELIFMQMEILTRGTGKMIYSMVMG
jgi:hypothetical protein